MYMHHKQGPRQEMLKKGWAFVSLMMKRWIIESFQEPVTFCNWFQKGGKAGNKRTDKK